MTDMKRLMTNISLSVIAVCLIGFSFVLSGCESGAPTSAGASDTATIVGTVSAFSIDGVSLTFLQQDHKQTPVVRCLGAISELLVPGAMARVPGVTVWVEGTDLAAVTDQYGDFAIPGVPAGEIVLHFSYGEASVSLEIAVPGGARVKLGAVEVRDNYVAIESVEIEFGQGAGGNENSEQGNENSDEVVWNDNESEYKDENSNEQNENAEDNNSNESDWNTNENASDNNSNESDWNSNENSGDSNSNENSSDENSNSGDENSNSNGEDSNSNSNHNSNESNSNDSLV